MQSFALALAIKRTSTKRKYTITQVTTTYNNTLVKKNMQKHKKPKPSGHRTQNTG